MSFTTSKDPNYLRFLAESAAASASAPPPQALNVYTLEQSETSARPPTRLELHALTAVNAGMLGAMKAARHRGPKSKAAKKAQSLAREGQVVSKMFDAFGARPIPRNNISLEDSIMLEMRYESMTFLNSSNTSGVFTANSLIVSVGQFSGASALLSVFDQYRIEQIEVWLECVSPNNQLNFAELVSAVDLDDGNTATAVGQIADKPGAIMAIGPAGHYHKWRPHIAVAVFSGAFTSYGNAPAQWIDSASPNVQHFGLKAGTVSYGATTGFNAIVRAVVSFRAPGIA